ncbi:hypothetical protein [Actinokineospora inagensis]|uniref:hypothetical protein n=1 Tax=Actinokineospora inagensis TaxID=103730 RepID=UPI0004030777|nr:hypothetical protein [Actinokineospora inagensis]
MTAANSPSFTRRVLLDALTALRDQTTAVTVVGAQAVYLRSDDVRLAVAAFTSDADVSLDPGALQDVPRLEQAMLEAGFTVGDRGQPGTWLRDERVNGKVVSIPVDLLVPQSLTPGRRGGKIPRTATTRPGGSWGLRRPSFDRDLMDVTALDSGTDRRGIKANVAGPAALLIAKAHEIGERAVDRGRPDRLIDKDAGDIARLMMADGSGVEEVAARVRRLQADPRTVEVTNAGLRYLDELFGSPSAVGLTMAHRALAEPPGVLPRTLAYIDELKMELTDNWPPRS